MGKAYASATNLISGPTAHVKVHQSMKTKLKLASETVWRARNVACNRASRRLTAGPFSANLRLDNSHRGLKDSLIMAASAKTVEASEGAGPVPSG